MWNIKNWWNKDKIELQRQLKDANERLDNTLMGLDQHMALNESVKAQLKNETKIATRAMQDLKDLEIKYSHLNDLYEEIKKANPDMKAEGVLTPWFVVGVNGESELKGLKTYMDWNDAMIQHMKDKQLNYKTDDEMIQHFVAQLYEHVLMILDAKILDDSDLHRKNEFE